uniref:DNA-directed RNA polymerase n=1 Tax=Vitis vinifera TaxID=29760 RepID=A5B3D8_VITVI|nr:hypothetical protein VITISV_004392 [Vitis vinifera]
MLDGHVKTLHPNIHGGILARRDQKHHMEALNEHGIGTFDVVVVNLYPFYDKVSLGGIEFEDEIETQAQDSDEPVKQSREGCDAQQPKKQQLYVERVLNVLKKMSDEDYILLGLNTKYARPNWMILQVLLIPSPPVKTSIMMDTSSRREDDLTH